MLDLAFAMAPPPDADGQGGGSLLSLFATNDHDVFDFLLHLDQATTEETKGNPQDA